MTRTWEALLASMLATGADCGPVNVRFPGESDHPAQTKNGLSPREREPLDVVEAE